MDPPLKLTVTQTESLGRMKCYCPGSPHSECSLARTIRSAARYFDRSFYFPTKNYLMNAFKFNVYVSCGGGQVVTAINHFWLRNVVKSDIYYQKVCPYVCPSVCPSVRHTRE